MMPDHSWACVVAFHDPATRGPRFRRYKGMLFGLPLAVSAFNRLAASDAAQDGYQIGSAAFLVVCPSFKRVGAVVLLRVRFSVFGMRSQPKSHSWNSSWFSKLS